MSRGKDLYWSPSRRSLVGDQKSFPWVSEIFPSCPLTGVRSFIFCTSARQNNHAHFTGKCMLYSSWQLPPPLPTPHPIIHVFPFLNKQFTVYKFSIFYKHSNPNNQPYYYIITFTQYTKILLFLIDMKGK